MSPGAEVMKMHPGMFAWWHARRHASCGDNGCGASAGHGPESHFEGPPWGWHAAHHGHGGDGRHDDFGGGSFGVRRPLRFLAYKLDLDDAQTTELASILSGLKTERAQAAVDHRRTTSSLADAVAAESFDENAAKAAAGERVKSTEGVEAAVVRALARIHDVLRPEQRSRLAYLLRTGALSM
jgi:Spy/CpxP family protein refolding chaperone